MKAFLTGLFILVIVPTTEVFLAQSIMSLWAIEEGDNQVTVTLPDSSETVNFSLKHEDPNFEFLVFSSQLFLLRNIETQEEVTPYLISFPNPDDGGPEVYMTQFQVVAPRLLEGWWEVESNSDPVYLVTDGSQRVSVLTKIQANLRIALTFILMVAAVSVLAAAVLVLKTYAELRDIERRMKEIQAEIDAYHALSEARDRVEAEAEAEAEG